MKETKFRWRHPVSGAENTLTSCRRRDEGAAPACGQERPSQAHHGQSVARQGDAAGRNQLRALEPPKLSQLVDYL